jgi:signal transduction histidine kinase/DNA-binding response OmpR family regulator/ligand-binding sensor domain-containing protein
MLIGTADCLEAYRYDSGIFTRVQLDGSDIQYAASLLQYKERIIIAAGENLYQYKRGSIERLAANIPYSYLCVDKFGILWGLNHDTVYRIDDQFHVVKEYTLESDDSSPLKGICIFPDSKGCVWIGTVKDGLYRYNRALDYFHKDTLASRFNAGEIENITHINEDAYDRLWIGHQNKLSVYDYNNNYFKSYMFENNYNVLLNTTITRIYRTKSQEMVLGTFVSGFFYIKELNSSMQFYNLAGDPMETGEVTVNGIIKDRQGNILSGTNRMGICVFDKSGKLIKQIDRHRAGLSNDIVAIEFDEEGNLWAGAMFFGLYKITRDVPVAHYMSQVNDTTTLSGNSIFALHSINRDSLMVASNKGIDIYCHRTRSFSNVLYCGNQDFAFCDILSFKEKIYVINFNSIYCFDRVTKKTEEFSFTRYKEIYIQCGFITEEGKLLLGTSKGGLFLFERGELIPYITDTALNGNIAGIQGDREGNIWLAGGNNLFCITPLKTVKKFNLAWGLGKNEFNSRSSYTDSTGAIYFGTSEGICRFDPARTNHREEKKPFLFISGLKLFNEPVAIDESSILKRHINHTDKLILNHEQNFISFEITCIDYTTDRDPPYKCLYQLANFSEHWYEVNPVSNEISFTGLPTGNYTLHVRIETVDKNLLASKTIEIEVKPPLFLSPYMIGLYLVGLGAIAWFIRVIVRKQMMHKRLMHQAKVEQAEISRMNALKLDFFTYISHEFKTPLAIISTLQEEILPGNEPDSDSDIFKRSVKRLEFLINQLMNFRNIESQHAPVEIKKYDIILFLHGIYEAFTPLYKRKRITHQFVTRVDTLPILFDADKIEMLVGNLLSNTFKHTGEGGECYMKLYTKDRLFVIDIFNSGTCLTDEQKVAIFQPYNRTDTSSHGGIGLAIVNSIAKLLDIHLSVVAIENSGNVFRVEMPIIQDEELQVSRPKSRANIVDQIIDNTIYIEEQGSARDEQEVKNFFHVLLVEHDADTKKLLRKKLREFFHVLIASNGNEALLLMKSQNVDIVISDIHIPGMDGFELCRVIKENGKTRHIPIILVTPDLSAENKIKGFRHGADALLQKPINMQELLLRLNNILKNRNVLRTYYANFNPLDTGEREVNNADEIFIRELVEYVHHHLGDSNLSVNQLSKHTNVSRTQLYLNIKRLTNQTPSSFILNIKMAQAKKLLATTGMTSSEISYKLGYCNPNHFSRQFKGFYHVSPGEFRKQNSGTYS